MQVDEDVRVEKVSKLMRLVCVQQDEGIFKLNGKETNPQNRCYNLSYLFMRFTATGEPQPPLINCEVMNTSSRVEL